MNAVLAWSIAGLVAFAFLPWYALPAGAWWPEWPGGWMADARGAAGLWQGLLLRQPALLVPGLALLAGAATPRLSDARLRATCLAAAGLGGAAWLVACTLLVPAAPGLPLGSGAAVVAVALVVLGATGLAHTGLAFRGDAFACAVALLAACLLALFVAWPLARGLGAAWFDEQGRASFAAGWSRIASARVWSLACVEGNGRCGVAWNTLLLAVLTAGGTTLLGGLLALAELRSGSRLARSLRFLAPLPFVLPAFVAALALILLFGRAGLVSQALEAAFGIAPGRWLYGLPGLWLAQMFAFTPVAYLILRAALQGLDPALEESARTLSASPAYAFRRVTLPLLAPAVGHAFVVGLLESVGDFGSALVVGGSYEVLATDVFYAIVGAQFADGGRAAGLAWVLALFAVIAFSLERALLRQRDAAPADARPAQRPPLPGGWRALALGVSLPWLLVTVVLYASALVAAFVESWGRDHRLTLRHFVRAFDVGLDGGPQLAGLAWPSFLNSLQVAAVAAALITAGSVLLAWLLQRHRFRGQGALEFTMLMAFAVPGTVLGLSYTLVFSQAPLQVTGTLAVIVLCLVFRGLPVAVGITGTALRQVDRSMEEASRVLGAPSWRILRDITLPLLRPALASALVYGFVRSFTTLSAVVFLVTAENDLATTFIVGRVGQGDWGLAFAYSTVVVALLVLVMAAARRIEAGVRLGRTPRPLPLVGVPA